MTDFKPHIKTRILPMLAMVLLCSFTWAQNLTGPTSVSPNSTHVYTFDNGTLHASTWTAVNGTVQSTTKPGKGAGHTTYTATVQWNASGSGSITFNSFGSPVETLNVTIGAPTGNTNLSDRNYIHTLVPRVATTDVTQLANNEKIESVTYFDGLGRGEQSIGIRAGASDEDIITYMEYDDLGRQVKEYLPFATTINGGSFNTSALSETNSFYNTAKYENTTNPYSEKAFEASPLNRVLKQAAPGEDWKMGNNHEIRFDYLANKANEVRHYEVTLSFANNTYTPTLVLNTSVNNGYYLAGELYKTVTKNENWISGKDNTIEEFKDAEGRVLLKRTYNNEVAHDTYYVYDDYGNLSYVLPPLAEGGTGLPNATTLDQLCYQYIYDHRNRVVEKKLPGKGWEYIVYNRLDMPILSQDANLKGQYQWLFTKYEIHGRVAYTGLISSGSTRIALQNAANGNSNMLVSKLTSPITLAGTTLYYSNGGYPTTNITEIYTINYYDSYSFDLAGGNSESAYGVTPITNVKGLASGSKVRVLGTSDWITSVSYYDAKGRPIYAYNFNDYLNTTDKVKSDLAFDGTVDETTSTHARTGYSTITTVDTFEYDHTNRLSSHKQSINGASVKEVIVENSYDNLGQLESKGVGGKTTQSRLQDIDFTYNVRGWLKTINDVANMGSDLFAFKLNYNTKEMGGWYPKLYNGNISEAIWKTANDVNANGETRAYAYRYDDLNRILNADYGIKTTGTYNLSSGYDTRTISYDKNGNLLNLTRVEIGEIDQLVYSYNGNQLTKVDDLVTSSQANKGFDDGTNTGNDYTYDANGNMLTDANKGISTNISYNHLNLPTQVTFSSGNIQYIYDATGVKLKKIVSTGTTTDYAGPYIYEGGTLKFFSQPEGYVEPDGSSFDYVYQYKDHLGNIRLTYADSDGNGSINASTEIIEEHNYYAYGLKHQGYNTNVSANVNSAAKRWMFGGMEYGEELGLDWYDISARNYDPALGRWMNIDPLAEQMRRHSPYNYAFDNPIFFLDPDGMMPCPNGNCPDQEFIPNEDTIVNTTNKTIIGENVVNELDEVIIGVVYSFDAEGSHVESTEKGKRFNGFKIEGKMQNNNSENSFKLTGFSAGHEDNSNLGITSKKASVHGMKLELESNRDFSGDSPLGSLGVENINTKTKASLFEGNADGAAGAYTGPDGEQGFVLEGNLGVNAANIEAETSIKIFGFRIGITRGSSLGSAQLGGGVRSTVSEDGALDVKAQLRYGFGVGKSYGFSFSSEKLPTSN